MKSNLLLFVLISLAISGFKKPDLSIVYESTSLKIAQLSESTFQHTTYLKIEGYGNFGCNGLIVINNGEALIIDTPVNDADAKELLDWIEHTLKCKPIGVVVTHFHNDCLGGLNEFHKREISSYANTTTIEMAKSDNTTLPQNGFKNYLELKVGNENVMNEFLGEGHTRDNIVSYFPSEKVLFGGCLIKEIGAGKGNLEDANIDEWPKTVTKVRSRYGKAEVVIPGHGKSGGQELLEYTSDLFTKK